MDYKNLTQGPGYGEITWVITFDHGVCNDCENANIAQVDQLQKDGFTQAFRLLDDDDEVYYTGWIKPDTDEFAPLDDFGMPNAGCTSIQFQKEDTWETV